MTPTPSPDTVEPTEAERNLARSIAFAVYGGPFDDDEEDGGVDEYYANKGAELLHQHVAAEVARETAELREERERLRDLWQRAHNLI